MTEPASMGDGPENGPGGTFPTLSLGRLATVFVVALALRGGFGVYQMGAAGGPAVLTFPDEQQYWSMSRELRAGGVLTDELGFHATRMPLYPGLLALFPDSTGGLIGARCCQWLIGALAAPLVALLGARILGSATGLVAGLMVAVDPGLVGLSSLLLTETAFVTVVAALWWASWPLVRRDPSFKGWHGSVKQTREGLATSGYPWGRWALTGGLSALCIYVRPSAAGLVLVWTGFLAVRQGLASARSWGGALMVLAIVALCLVPWAARNRRVTGDWCWLTHRAGISLYDGVGPQASGAGDLGQIKNMPAVGGLDEVEWNRWFLRASWASIREDPGRIVGLAGVKLARTWSPFLHAEELRSTSVRLVFAVWSIAVYALAIAGAALLRRRPALIVGLMVPGIYLAVLHSVFVGSVRYRVGAAPALAVLAGFALVALVRRRTARR